MLRNTLRSLAAALPAMVALTGCPGIGDIDRTQPEKVLKSTFVNADGSPAEFYFRQTVIDVPATNGVTFIGEQSDTERVVFEVTENFLFAYRSYGWLENESTAGAVAGNQGDGYSRPGVRFTGTPVAAFPIRAHFDVKRQYNAQTGEQTNVLVEDMQDRAWYQRDYIRVDWSTNQIADFRFGSATVLQTPASYSVPQEDGQGDDKDRPKISPEYIDIVTKFNVEPEAIDLSYYGYGMVPECYFSSSSWKDCFGGTIKVRSSFRRVVESDYIPQPYDDVRFQKFGFFRTERYRYNDEYGVIEPSQVRLANRWNLWKDAESCYDANAEKPYGACGPEQLRTIVYYLNEDFPTSPASMRDMALANADQWNDLFREAVKSMAGFTDEQIGDHRMFTICANNPVVAGDPEECGPAGTNPQIGDLRYSMYYYIPNFQFSPPLGYGPSAADPKTGEIIAGNAFYYGAAGATIAARTRDIVKLQLGLLSEDDITGGLPARDAATAAGASSTTDHRSVRGEHIADKARQLAERLKIKDKGQRLRAQVASGEAFVDKRAGRLAALKNSGLDDMMVTDEMREVFGPQLLDEGVAPDQADAVLAARLFDDQALFGRERARRQRLLTPAANGCILSAEDVFDDALLGLVAKIRNKFYDVTANPATLKGSYTEQDVYDYVLSQTMGDTQLHEIGHTVGLRHNFSGSTDALNFGPGYWELRGGIRTTQNDPRPAKEWEITGPLVAAQQSALDDGLRDEQGSTVMDYASTYGTVVRLGSYDLAAIKYAYGDMVEVFNAPELTTERAQLLKAGEVHYTNYPEVVSDGATYEDRVASMYDRANVNFRKVGASGKQEVPFSFCSDEYRDASSTCAIWDQGADNFERTVYEAEHYRNYALFSSFKRERLTFGLDIYAYLSRVYTVDFTYVLNQYKNWVNDELFIRDGKPCLVVRDGQIEVDSTDRFAANECGLAGFLGTVEAINMFASVIETPDVGCYVRLQPGCYDTVAGNYNLGAVEDPDIDLVDADPTACDGFEPTQPADATAPRRVALKVTDTTPYEHIQFSTSCDGVTTASAFMEEPLELKLGNARPANTLYDRARYGYYFYDKPLVMGSWWDKWMAVKALGDPNTDFIGVDASSDPKAFLISLNTLFASSINDLIGGTVTEKMERYAPILNADGNDAELVPLLDVNTGNAFDRSHIDRPLINPDQQYTLRLVSMFNAAYNGQYTDDFEFGESLQVGLAYNVTDIDVPDAVRGNSARYAELTDPVTGYKWYALNQHRDGEDNLYSVGYQYIREIKQKYYVDGADGPGTELIGGVQGSFEFLPRRDIEMLRIMASTAKTFGFADVWSGDVEF